MKRGEAIVRALPRATPELLELAEEAGGIGLWEWKPKTGELTLSPRLIDQYGLSKFNGRYETWMNAVHREDRVRMADEFDQCFAANKDALRTEFRVRAREDGELRWIEARSRIFYTSDGTPERVVGVHVDVTERKRMVAQMRAFTETLEERVAEQQRIAQELDDQRHILETLNRTASALAAELDLQKLVQAVTDVGTELSGAQFGAFFYNVIDAQGESFTLYAIAGVARENFSKFPMPRNTAVFEPTFRGDGIVRSDDIKKDARYGRNAPNKGMPEGHLPVCSYLASPVKSRSGEVLGGLFFGHGEPGRFSASHEAIVAGLAAQAAISIDNARLFQCAQQEISDRAAAEAALREREADLRLLLNSIAEGFYAVDRQGVTTLCNAAFVRMLGFADESEPMGKALHDVIHHSRADGTHYPKEECPIYRTAGTGTSTHVEGEYFFRLDGSSFPVEYWVHPVIRNGALDGAICVFVDITERTRLEEGRRLLVRELNHRVKNLFAVVGGMITLTMQTAASAHEAGETLKGRVQALAKAHELIAPAISSEARPAPSMTRLVSEVLRPYLGAHVGRIAIAGPDLRIGSASATSMALILHELATNAIKYGALSTTNGKLEVVWRIDGDDFLFEWTESGGPTIETPPERRGFGSKLATMSAGQLRGVVAFDWRPEGLRVKLRSMAKLLSDETR